MLRKRRISSTLMELIYDVDIYDHGCDQRIYGLTYYFYTRVSRIVLVLGFRFRLWWFRVLGFSFGFRVLWFRCRVFWFEVLGFRVLWLRFRV